MNIIGMIYQEKKMPTCEGTHTHIHTDRQTHTHTHTQNTHRL